MKIAFDVNGCLIKDKGRPRIAVIELLKALSKGNHVIMWSSVGILSTQKWMNKLGLSRFVNGVAMKQPNMVDIAIDDEKVKLGKFNIQV